MHSTPTLPPVLLALHFRRTALDLLHHLPCYRCNGFVELSKVTTMRQHRRQKVLRAHTPHKRRAREPSKFKIQPHETAHSHSRRLTRYRTRRRLSTSASRFSVSRCNACANGTRPACASASATETEAARRWLVGSINCTTASLSDSLHTRASPPGACRRGRPTLPAPVDTQGIDPGRQCCRSNACSANTRSRSTAVVIPEAARHRHCHGAVLALGEVQSLRVEAHWVCLR